MMSATIEDWYLVEVKITRHYHGSFYGTKKHAEQQAVQSFKQHANQFYDEEIITILQEEND